jgi:hypothetical protein
LYLSPKQAAAARAAQSAALQAAKEVDEALYSLRNADFMSGRARIRAEERWHEAIRASDKANRVVSRIYTGEYLV